MAATPDQLPHRWPSLAWWLPPRSVRQAHAAFWLRYPVDRFGDAIHLALGCLFCFAATWPISIAESAALALAICWLVRLPFLVPSQVLLLRQWHLPPLLLLMAWQGLGLIGAADLAMGAEQWGVFRFLALIPALYPLARHRGWLMLAAVAGFAINPSLQVLEAVAPAVLDVPALEHRTPEGRIGGWWSPVVAGELLVGALAVHAAALLHARSRSVVIVAVAGSLLCVAGIVLSGTRAAWIAAPVLLLGVAAVAVRTRLRSPARRFAAVVALILILGAATLVILATPAGRGRLADARDQLTLMVERGESSTSVGLRIRMLQWGWRAFEQHPLSGIGPGQFPASVIASKPDASGDELAAIERFERERHGHCHNTPLALLIAAGVPGLVLFVVAIATCLVAGFRRGQGQAEGPDLVRAYAAAPPWLVLSTVLLWPFDALTVSVHPTMFMMLGIALCPGWIPAMPGDRPATPDAA